MESNILVDIFNTFGENGPNLLLLSSIFFLRKKNRALLYYIVGYFINIVINYILKGIIKEARPGISQKKIDLLFENNNMFVLDYNLSHEIFGMPSGHAQTVFYTVIFDYLVLKENTQTCFYLIIALITVIQRVVFGYHTVKQVIAGAIIGMINGYIFYLLFKEGVKGKLTAKKDDGALN